MYYCTVEVCRYFPEEEDYILLSLCLRAIAGNEYDWEEEEEEEEEELLAQCVHTTTYYTGEGQTAKLIRWEWERERKREAILRQT